jgi:hypothetical protein
MNNNNISSVAGLFGQAVQLTNTTATTTLNVGSGSATTTTLLTKFNNGRTAVVGEASLIDFNAKNSAGTEFNYANIAIGSEVVTAGSERGSLTLKVKDSNTSVVSYLTCNGVGGSVQINAPFLDMVSHPITAVTTITDNQSLPFLPQVDIEANSNVPNPIPAYVNRHQVLLRGEPVPNIDRFLLQSQFVSGAVRCSCEGLLPSFGNSQWLGTPNGEVYIYDGTNWTLVASFTGNAGTINALFYNTLNDRLYIGGSFTDCTYPSAVPNLNNVCYIQSPSTTPTIPTQMVWAGGVDAGFNAQCNAIAGAGTGDYVYFGGNFDYTFNNFIQLQYFGCYQESTNIITPINGNPSDGFSSSVYNLNYLASVQCMCATGDFTVLTSGAVGFTSPYCITFTIATNAVSAINILDGGATSLSTSIQGYDLLKNNGANFLVGLGNQTYFNGVDTINYLMNMNSSAQSGTEGANLYSEAIGSFFYNGSAGYVEAVTAGSYTYFQNGSPYAVIPFQPFLFRFQFTGISYFNRQSDGTQWAFTGSFVNTFPLSGGRTIEYGGVTFSGGVNTSSAPFIGQNLLLNWNTAYYIVVGTPQGSWTFF